MQFSLIIPWRSGNPVREQSLHNLLNCINRQNLKQQVSYELIIVEHCDRQDQNEQNQSARNKINELMPQELAGYNYIQLYDGTPSFNKSWCMNVGARAANHNRLMFIDGDSLFGADYLVSIANQLEKVPTPNSHIMLCWNYLIAAVGRDNPITRYITPDMTAALGGIWCADKDFYFTKFGGMNENFLGYGGEDNDAYERSKFLMGLESIGYLAYTITHQYHDWEKQHTNAIKYFEIGRKYPQIVSDRIVNAGIGQLSGPTMIDIESLKI